MKSPPTGRDEPVVVTEDQLIENANAQHLSTDHLVHNLKGRTISSGFVTLLAQAVQFFLTIGSTMILARLLTPQDFGLLAMVTTVVGILNILRDAGLSTATVQRQGITHAQVSNLFWINLSLGVVVTILVALSAPVIAWFYREPRTTPITLLLSLTFVLHGAAVQHMALLNRQMRFMAIAAIETISMLLGILAGITLAWLEFGHWALVWATMLTALSRFLGIWSVSRWRPQLPVRQSGTRPLVAFGANTTVAGILYSFARSSDTLLMGRFLGTDAVGLYSRASGLLMRPMMQLMSPLSAVLVPAFSRLQDRPERYRQSFLDVHAAIATVAFLFTGLFLPLSEPLTLLILGAKWQAAAPIFAGFTVAAIFLPLCGAASWLLETQGRGRDSLIQSVVVSLVTILSFVCSLPFGPAAVSIVYSVAGVGIVLPVCYWIAGRQGPVATRDMWRGFLWHSPILVMVCGTTWLARQGVVDLAPLAQLVIGGAAGLSAGALFVWLFPPARHTALRIGDAIRELRR